jgi:mRNA interferase HigB
MKVNLIKKKTIYDYVINHSNGKNDFDRWLALILNANWNEPNDIRQLFPSADILGNGINRVIFNIGGNKFRLIASYYFGKKSVRLYVKWIGTHGEYDGLCRNGQQYFISQ